jgi:undecaprenyl-diphosphatase
MKRTASAQFSFLLSAPIVGGAVVKKMFEVMRDGLPPDQVTPFIVGIIVSAIFGMICIAGLLRYLQNRTTFIFINYRIGLGIVVLTLGYFYSLH